MDFCSFASGSSGNSTFVGTGHTSILIDAGISGKRITAALAQLGRKPEELDGILVTHEHSDHIKGLGVLSRKYGIPIYCTPGTKQAILGREIPGAVEESLFCEIRPDEDFTLGELKIHPFSVPHDAAQPVAYRVSHNKTSVAVVTDLGCFDDSIAENLKGLDVVLVEANHDVGMLQLGPYPYPLKRRILSQKGHLSNENAGRLIGRILHDHLKAIFLGHLSRQNNYEALALAAVRAEITMGDTPYQADDFPIQTAARDAPTLLM